MPKKPQDRVRLNLMLSKQVRGRLDALVEETEAETMTEVIRRSLELYELVIKVTQQGGSMYLRASDGTEERLVIL